MSDLKECEMRWGTGGNERGREGGQGKGRKERRNEEPLLSQKTEVHSVSISMFLLNIIMSL